MFIIYRIFFKLWKRIKNGLSHSSSDFRHSIENPQPAKFAFSHNWCRIPLLLIAIWKTLLPHQWFILLEVTGVIAPVQFYFNFIVSVHTGQVMLVLILIDVQYLQNVVFSFEKGWNDQNHSWSDSQHPIKKSLNQTLPSLYHIYYV